MADGFLEHIRTTLSGIEAEGLMKRERFITGAQGAHVRVGGRDMRTFVPTITSAWRAILDWLRRRGLRWRTTASVWPRYGSSAARRTSMPSLRRGLARFLGMEAAILFAVVL